MRNDPMRKLAPNLSYEGIMIKPAHIRTPMNNNYFKSSYSEFYRLLD